MTTRTRLEIDPERRERLATQLRNNELLPYLIAERMDEVREEWGDTDSDDRDGREALYREFKALRDLRDYINASIATGTGDGASE